MTPMEKIVQALKEKKRVVYSGTHFAWIHWDGNNYEVSTSNTLYPKYTLCPINAIISAVTRMELQFHNAGYWKIEGE